MRKQRVALEHHVYRPGMRRHVFHIGIVDRDMTAGGIGKTGQHAEQSGFAAARSTHQREHFAFIDLQAYAIHRGDVIVGFADVIDDDLRLRIGVQPLPIGKGWFRRCGHA